MKIHAKGLTQQIRTRLDDIQKGCTQRTLGPGNIEVCLEKTRKDPGSDFWNHGGGVSKAYLKKGAAYSTVCATVRRQDGAVIVLLDRKFLTKTTTYLLRHICRKLVVQGCIHQERITAFYRIMVEAARTEFYEDNELTLHAFLRECHEAALVKGPPTGQG